MLNRKSILKLSDGTTFSGWQFGAGCPAEGEVVFSTSMVGYPESLTDPSYQGQILCVCYPLVGNYGIPEPQFSPDGICLNFESEDIHVRGLVISDYSQRYSHHDAVRSLSSWMESRGIPGICGVDTRALTHLLREKSGMDAMILPEGSESCEKPGPHPVAQVSCKSVLRYGSGHKRVVLVDCGVKHNILRCLVKRGIEVVRVPWDYDYTKLDYDGLFISNGPGDPRECGLTISHLRKSLEEDRPVFGVCLGSQLMALAAGASTYRMPYGHRSHNQPVRMSGSRSCFITSQNHGYAVDTSSLPPGWEEAFVNLNDGTNEGIRHIRKPFMATQFHPEASGGPVDTEFLFDEFFARL